MPEPTDRDRQAADRLLKEVWKAEDATQPLTPVFAAALAAVRAEERQRVTRLCAEMVASARRHQPYNGAIGAGYRLAQEELAEMLRLVARGEIDLQSCEEAHGVSDGK
jgi:hypothetical protein